MKNIDNRGIVLANSIIIMSILLVLGVGLISLILANSAFINKEIQSTKALSIAEAGIERALWQLNQQNSNYTGELDNQTVDGGSFDVTIEEIDSESKFVTAIAYSPSKQNPKVTRSVRVKIEATASEEGGAFHYGVQVGDLGLTMSNNAKIYGNVYSGGNITGGNGSLISGDAYVSGIGNRITGTGNSQRINIGNTANAHTLQYSNITHDAYYFSDSTLVSCTVSGTKYPNSPVPPTQPLPLTDETITNWEQAAAAGGTINGTQNIDGSSVTMGPKKIVGDLIVTNGATLTITGVIWVSGNISFSNNAIIRLDPSYADKSGMIIADDPADRANKGRITSSNNVIMQGSSDPKSYIMGISMNTSSNLASPAINVANNAESVVYYAQKGVLEVSNNAELMSVVGRGLHLSNGAEVHYDTGLANASFVTGPGGVWVISPKSWEKL